MKKLIILAMCIAALSCSSSNDDVSAPTFKIDISGTVMDSKSNAVLGGIPINLYSNGRILMNTASGESGTFFFDDLDVGTYSLRVSAEGYEEYIGIDTLIKTKGYVESISLVSTEPKIGSVNVTNIGQTSASLNSSVVEAGNPRFTERGFCYSRELGDVEFNCSAVEGEFIKVLENLTDNTKYYVKAYMDNGKHPRQYSAVAEFTTSDGKPIASVPVAISVGYDTASVQASVTFVGAPSYITAENGERGFCVWTDTLTIKDHCDEVAGTSTSFSKTFFNLKDSTKYYAISYMDNGKHPKYYSSVLSFTTFSGMANVSISPVTNIAAESALLRATILNSPNSDYTEKGFCYSAINSLPSKNTVTTICKSVEGTTAAFEQEIDSFEFSKIYYVRAYIENSYGIRYSNAVEFKIINANVFLDSRDGREYKVERIGNSIIWFFENLAYNSKSYYSKLEAVQACPEGWHLPSDADWETLKSLLTEENKSKFTANSSSSWWSSTPESRYPSYNYIWTISLERDTYSGDANAYLAAVRCVNN
jgi:hypothetical protein